MSIFNDYIVSTTPGRTTCNVHYMKDSLIPKVVMYGDLATRQFMPSRLP